METIDIIIYALYALCAISLVIFAKATWSLSNISEKVRKKSIETDSKKN